MTKQYYCYIWADPKNGLPRYVGKGTKNRVWAHLEINGNSQCSRMLKKRHSQNFICLPKIIMCENEEKAFELEKDLIKKFGREDIGTGTLFNKTDGGDGVSNISENTRSKMSIAKKGKPGRVMPQYQKDLQSKRMTGVENKSGVKLQKRCTVDGLTIYPSVAALTKALGYGKNGIRSPNLKFL
jgi:hypothetical protein